MAGEGEVVERTLIVGNQFGLHARVATMVVQAMKNFSCKVTLVKDDIEVDAGSVLELLLLAATPGSEILVRAQGPDSIEAIKELHRLIQHDESNGI
ncbi:MAG: HPr family phosphocarrier protein [Desulfomonile sp.]|jgi:phosphocarrier protein